MPPRRLPARPEPPPAREGQTPPRSAVVVVRHAATGVEALVEAVVLALVVAVGLALRVPGGLAGGEPVVLTLAVAGLATLNTALAQPACPRTVRSAAHRLFL